MSLSAVFTPSIQSMLSRLYTLTASSPAGSSPAGDPLVALPKEFATARLIAAGPMTWQPASTPARIVLVLVSNELVVWEQIYKDPEKQDSYFSCGDYFRLNQLSDAVARFAERIARQTHGNLDTLYRE